MIPATHKCVLNPPASHAKDYKPPVKRVTNQCLPPGGRWHATAWRKENADLQNFRYLKLTHSPSVSQLPKVIYARQLPPGGSLAHKITYTLTFYLHSAHRQSPLLNNAPHAWFSFTKNNHRVFRAVFLRAEKSLPWCINLLRKLGGGIFIGKWRRDCCSLLLLLFPLTFTIPQSRIRWAA